MIWKVADVRLAAAHYLYSSFLATGEESFGDAVVFPIGKSYDWGRIVGLSYSKKKPNLLQIKRIMEKQDWETVKKNKIYAKEVYEKSKEKIKDFNLCMELLKVHVSLDTTRLYLFYTAREKVDFRKLAEELSKIFKARIQFYQLNLQQKLVLLGWYGPCGRPLCCSLFLRNLPHVKIKQIKKQNILLVPERIRGSCGKLKCCFSFESTNEVT